LKPFLFLYSFPRLSLPLPVLGTPSAAGHSSY
jgi:hypothetical protein